MNHKIISHPTTIAEAKERGSTWFYSNRACSTHNNRFHWAHSGACMACRDFWGQPYVIIPLWKDLSKSRKRAPKEWVRS